MDNLLPFLAVGAIVLIVIVFNLNLIAALRRKPGAPEDPLVRGVRAFSAASKARQKQAADLDELHRRVEEIQKGQGQ